jgi:hypothetical protein
MFISRMIKRFLIASKQILNKKFLYIKLIIFAVGLVIILTALYFVKTGKYIYWSNPKLLFEAVEPSSIAKFPVLEDCRVGFDKKYMNLNYEPNQEILEEIEFKKQLLTKLKLNFGYSTGRYRKGGGMYCNNWFYLGIKELKSGKILFGDDQAQAFKITSKDDLNNLADMLYGKVKEQSYKKLYDRLSREKSCYESRNSGCVKIKEAYPDFLNGQIVEDGGKIELHRIVVEDYIPNHYIYHKILRLNSNGVVGVESKELIFYDDGRIINPG